MSPTRLCRSAVALTVLLGLVVLDIAPVYALVPANKVLGLTPPRLKEFDEVTNQYFTHKNEGEKEGCISVFSPDNVLVKEDFGCCPAARNMVVRVPCPHTLPPPPNM